VAQSCSQAPTFWNANNTIVQAWRAWYFMSCEKRPGGYRDLNCTWTYPKTQNRKMSMGCEQLATYL